MAPSIHILCAWTIRDIDAYGGGIDGISTGLGFAHCFLDGTTLSPIFHNGTEKTIRSVLINQFSTEEWAGMAVGDYTTLMECNTSGAGEVMYIQVEKRAAGEYRFRLHKTGGSPWTENGNVIDHAFGLANRFNLRAITDGTNWTLDVDGTQEVSHAESSKILLGTPLNLILRGLPSGAGDSTKRNQYKYVCYYSYDTADERLSANIKATMMYPNANGHHTQFSGAFGNVDDWSNATHDGITTEDISREVETDGVSAAWQTYDLTDPGMVNDLGCLLVVAEVRVEYGAKSAITAIFLDDGSHAFGPTITNLGTAYITPSPQRAIFETKPSGGAWTDASLDGLEIGVRIQAGDEAVEQMAVTAIQAEFFDFIEDPPAVVTTSRRSALAQVI